MARSLRTCACFFVAIAALLATDQARADVPQAPALHWSRATNASACIDPGTLAARVEQLTGPILASPAAAERAIEGHIEALPQGGGYRARLTVSERGGAPQGERIIEHPGSDCRALDTALAFVIAVMIDPELEIAGLPRELLPLVVSETPAEEKLSAELAHDPPQPAKPPAVVATEAISEPPPAPADEVAPERTGEREVGLLALLQTRVAEGPLVGAAAQLGLALTSHWTLLAGLRAATGIGPMSVGSDPQYQVKAQAFDALVGVCVGTSAANELSLRACLSPEYSLWRQRGVSFSPNRTALLSGFGVSLLVALRYRVARAFSVELQAGARVNTLSRTFVYDDQGTDFSVPRLTFVTALGPIYAF